MVLVAHAVKALVPNEQRLEVSQRLVRLQLDREGPVLNLVLPLLDSGLSGTEPAEAFEAAADEAAESDPALAAEDVLKAVVDISGIEVGKLAARAADEVRDGRAPEYEVVPAPVDLYATPGDGQDWLEAHPDGVP